MLSWLRSNYEAKRLELSHIMQQLQKFTRQIGHEESSKVLADLRDRLDEPYMFVIVGEVKAGKSSFINALLEDPSICAVAPSPMTDTIQQILYGSENKVEQVSPYFKRVYQPNRILREIAIVDTPGTNTILAHHQEITERFVPGADLIVFVFEAKNPYRQSAWDFFNYLHKDWLKKVIFILQQKDLMTEDDLAINHKGLKDHLIKIGMNEPIIFNVSAKQELDGLKDQSGFKPLRSYIEKQVAGGNVELEKLNGMYDTVSRIILKIQQGVKDRQAQFEADTAFRNEIQETLFDHGQRSKHQADMLIENLLGAFDRISSKYEKELSDSISFFPVLRRSIGAIFSKSQSLKAWLEDFTLRIRNDFGVGMQERINDGVLDLAESIQQMVHHVDLQIRNSKTILANDHELFAEIASRRQNILRELREAFTQFIDDPNNFQQQGLVQTDTSVGTNVAASSGLAVVGIILAAVTQGMVFDITGGVLTAIGFIVAGVSLGLQRGKVLKQFRSEMDKGKVRLKDELHSSLYSYIESIKSRMEKQFKHFDELLEKEKTELGGLVTDLNGIESDLNQFRKNLR